MLKVKHIIDANALGSLSRPPPVRRTIRQDRMVTHRRIAAAMGCDAVVDQHTGEVVLVDKTAKAPTE